jgi:hypothetical protein
LCAALLAATDLSDGCCSMTWQEVTWQEPLLLLLLLLLC